MHRRGKDERYALVRAEDFETVRATAEAHGVAPKDLWAAFAQDGLEKMAAEGLEVRHAAPKKATCSACGEYGHRRRTCPKVPEALRQKPRCGVCGEPGHNARTCRQRRRGCSWCGETGHNRRTCPWMRKKCSYCGTKGHTLELCPWPGPQDPEP